MVHADFGLRVGILPISRGGIASPPPQPPLPNGLLEFESEIVWIFPELSPEIV